MSQSAIPGEDTAWTQTIVTVTPQDDGYLREIEDNVVVSGVADSPLHLDTGNIVMRRSLMNNTKNLINAAELEPLERIAAECQTYLQGVPKVELPLIYKDEATQTLYMKSDESPAFSPPFGDIITVMNEKLLPEWKVTRKVQTIITLAKEESSYDDIAEQLKSDDSEESHKNSDSIMQGTEEENALMEASDILNFVIDRTLWMKMLEQAPPIEHESVEVQTFLKYNHNTKKITIDHEVQTSLSCEPKYSNSMLLFEYNQAKNSGTALVNDMHDIVDEILMKCYGQINFPLQKESDTNEEELSELKNIIDQPEEIIRPVRKCPATCVSKVCPKLKSRTPRTEDILLADGPCPAVRSTCPAKTGRNLKRSCPVLVEIDHTSSSEESTRSMNDLSTFQMPEETSAESQRALTFREEEALGLLKRAFCNLDTCTRR